MGAPQQVLASLGVGFTPPDAGTMYGWYRGDLGVTISTGVSAWANQSGTAPTLAEGTGANQPTFSSSLINSQPGMTFDGSNDRLSVGSLSYSQPQHMFMVFRQKAWSSNGVVLSFDAANDIEPMNMPASGSTPQVGLRQRGDLSCFASPTINTAFLFQTFVSSSSSFTALNDGAAIQTPSPVANSDTLTQICLGAKSSSSNTQNTNFDICELAIYPAQITGANLTNLLNYFKARYALW